MTPFMDRVSKVLASKVATPPALIVSSPAPLSTGIAEQVRLRSLAERLVSEANAVLNDTRERILLEDHLDEDMIGFTLWFRDRQARVSTRYDNGLAQSRFDGWGSRCSQAVALPGPEALEDAVLLLVAGATRTPTLEREQGISANRDYESVQVKDGV